jgi:phage-related protein
VTERGLPAFQDFIERLAKFIGRVKEFWQDNAPAFREAFDRIRTVVVAVWDSLKPLITAIGDLFTAIFGGTKEGGSGNAFLGFLGFAVGLIETIAAVLKPVIDLLAGFFDLLAKIANSGFVKTVLGAIGNVASGIRNTFTGASQAARTNAVTAPRSFSAGLPSVAGPTRTNVTNITINGALDREGTARDINRILNDSARRTGPTHNVVFAPCEPGHQS